MDPIIFITMKKKISSPQEKPKNQNPHSSKKPYHSLQLKILGSLTELTQAKGGSRTDGASPKTKTTGFPA